MSTRAIKEARPAGNSPGDNSFINSALQANDNIIAGESYLSLLNTDHSPVFYNNGTTVQSNRGTMDQMQLNG